MKKESYEIKKASDFTVHEINKFKKILITEDEVIESTFDILIQKDPILLFYPNTKNIEAIGALKTPIEGYKLDVFKYSKSQLKSKDFHFELGWIVVLKRGIGIGSAIATLLSEYETKIYSTVREENTVMNHILKKIGFVKTGISYNSKRGDYKINLYILNK